MHVSLFNKSDLSTHISYFVLYIAEEAKIFVVEQIEPIFCNLVHEQDEIHIIRSPLKTTSMRNKVFCNHIYSRNQACVVANSS